MKSKIIRWASHVTRIEHMTGAYRVLVEKTEGERQHERRRPRWKNNTKNGSQRSGIGRHGLDLSASG